MVITNSTISGNTAGEHGGGISQSIRGSLNINSSTITDNHADGDGGGLRLTPSEGFHISHSLVSGNTASGDGAEIVAMSPQSSPVTHEFNIFGVDNQSGVVGFTPGPTDIVPAAGVDIGDILDPMLADNGGSTPTHALVPGSLAIDAGQADCTDAGGNPLTTDQRGSPRPVDGNGDSVAACDIGAFELQASDLSQVIDFEGLPAGKVVKRIYADGGFGPIQVRGFLDSKCMHNAAVVFDSSCANGVCSGGDDDLGTPNETFGGPGVGMGGEASRLSANDTPLGNLLIVHEKCREVSDRFVEDPNDTRGDSQITLRFPEPVRVFSYTIIDHEKSQGERDRVTFYGPQGKSLASMSSPDTGDNGKAVVETTSDGTGIGGVMRIVFKRTGSRGLDNIVFTPDASVITQHRGLESRHRGGR